MGNITKPPVDMLYHDASVEKGSAILSNGREFVPQIPNSEDSLTVMLDSEKCRFDSESGTLVLVHTNKAVTKITGFSELASMVEQLGRRGPRGPEGRPGKDGRPGRDGKNGDQGCPGAKGDTGPQGNTGATGPKGNTGERGETGATGATGVTGPRGSDATAGNLVETPAGTVESLKDSGRKFQWGHFEASGAEETITVLFPLAFDRECQSFQITWMRGASVQAQEYEITDLNNGGVTIRVPQNPPLADDWDFYWTAKGI